LDTPVAFMVELPLLTVGVDMKGRYIDDPPIVD
jgi:hypothetical protein